MSTVSDHLLEIRGLSKTFDFPAGFLRQRRRLAAVSDVDLDLPRAGVTGVVGESGCGKSTLARLVLRLIEPTSGSIRFDGIDLRTRSRGQMRSMRRHMQMVFQDPYSSIDPRFRIGDAIMEPLVAQGIRLAATERDDKVAHLLSLVGLAPQMARQFPHQLSGGQRQRIGIARALALDPKFLVLDEPTASLDVSIQAQIVALLERLKTELGLTYLFISHDLGLVRYFCDRVVVMYLGRIVEILPKADARPRHPYTRMLLDSTFAPDPHRRREIVPATGEIPSPLDLPRGCAFTARCDRATPQCRELRPELASRTDGTVIACHNPIS